jgi:hypothetical protein
MPKISALPSMTSPDTADPAPVVDDSTTVTKKLTLGGLRDWLYSLVNIPAGPASPVTRDYDHFFDHVASGLVISPDSAGVNRNASMTSGICYINGRRISLTAVNARTYTASRDTYVDVLDNGDGTGTLVYTEVTNNNASPALASNSIRIAIVVTGASTIAAAASINQGQETRVLPIRSSIPMAVTDELGNLICSRDPLRKVLGYREIRGNQTGVGTSNTQVTGLTIPVKVPEGRKVKITIFAFATDISSAGGVAYLAIWDGAVGGTQLQQSPAKQAYSGAGYFHPISVMLTPSTANKTFNVSLQASSGTAGIYATSTSPTYALVELA